MTQPRNITTLTGYDAIDYASEKGLTLCKYADPIEDARHDVTIDEARDIAFVDPSLIYVERQAHS